MTTLDQNREAIRKAIPLMLLGFAILLLPIALYLSGIWPYSKKPRTYMVSYVYGDKNANGPGYGVTSVTANKPIDTGEEVKKMCESIRDNQGFTNVVILNIQRLPL